MQVLDAAFPSWSLSQLVGLGVMRYVGSHGNPKNIGQGEYDALIAGKIPFGLVFESNGTDYVNGYGQGVTDGQTARGAAHGLGWPDGRPIYCTVDRGDGANPVIIDYQRGFNAGASMPIGAFYGDRALAAVLFAAGMIRWYWQPGARAWPGDATDDPRAALIQRAGRTVPGVAGSYDVNDVFATDWGQYPAPSSPVPAPKPQPPTTTPFPGGPVPDLTIFEQAIPALDEHGAGHVPIPGVKSGSVFSWGAIATPDPAKVGHYVPIPSVSLTIGADGFAELVLENGQPHGPASVRAVHG